MTPRNRKSRIYWRTRGGARRAYADFRDYSSVGGGLEALIPEGERRATSDPDVAQALVATRLKELDALRRGRALHGRARGATLANYAAEHLTKKAKAGKVTHDWMVMAEMFLSRAVEYFGVSRELESIGVEDVQGWATHLSELPRALGYGTGAYGGRGLARASLRGIVMELNEEGKEESSADTCHRGRPLLQQSEGVSTLSRFILRQAFSKSSLISFSNHLFHGLDNWALVPSSPPCDSCWDCTTMTIS